MNPSIISAMSALLGAAIGGLASFLASWMTQRMQMRAQWLTQERLRRQDLYKEFIEEASRCHIDALQHTQGDIPSRVTLYTKIGRMRIIATDWEATTLPSQPPLRPSAKLGLSGFTVSTESTP